MRSEWWTQNCGHSTVSFVRSQQFIHMWCDIRRSCCLSTIPTETSKHLRYECGAMKNYRCITAHHSVLNVTTFVLDSLRVVAEMSSVKPNSFKLPAITRTSKLYINIMKDPWLNCYKSSIISLASFWIAICIIHVYCEEKTISDSPLVTRKCNQKQNRQGSNFGRNIISV